VNALLTTGMKARVPDIRSWSRSRRSLQIWPLQNEVLSLRDQSPSQFRGPKDKRWVHDVRMVEWKVMET
jgi:hypothetical protein